MTGSPHAAQPIIRAGVPLPDARAVLILLHGRGASAEEIIALGEALAPSGCAFIAPQAAQHTWYPYSFLARRSENEPWLSSAIAKVQELVSIALDAGIPLSKVVLAGFSQGACLATEFIGRNPNRYGALLAFTGGLIGPLEEPIQLDGDLAGTPVLLSAGDPDPHVPWQRVEQTAELLRSIGGNVTLQRYPGKSHSIVQEEVDLAGKLLTSLALA
jgi:phospholipase/carboxylesterase